MKEEGILVDENDDDNHDDTQFSDSFPDSLIQSNSYRKLKVSEGGREMQRAREQIFQLDSLHG